MTNTQDEDFTALINSEFDSVKNLLEKHYEFIKDYRDRRDVESIDIILKRLNIARKKILEFGRKQKIL